MKIKEVGKQSWHILSRTYQEFSRNHAIKLSASLSYYTIFSLPPLLIIIISLASLFYGREAIQGEVFGQMRGLVGKEAALQIQETLKNVSLNKNNVFAAIIGFVTLLMGASGVFAEIQSSINFIWGLKAKPKRGFARYLKDRLMSFSMIATLGFLLMVSLSVNTVLEILFDRLRAYFADVTTYLFYAVNLVVVFVIISMLFALIFRTLPDGKVAWRDAFIGAMFTTVFFMVGKFAIGAYIGNSDVASAYGAAGSVLVIMVWVYYSSIILYFGAEFTKVYAWERGKKIIPNKYSVFIENQAKEIRR